MPKAQFASAIAVKGRGIEEAHTALPGSLKQRLRFGFGDGGAKAPNGRGTKAELCDAERCGADAAGSNMFHDMFPHGVIGAGCRALMGPRTEPGGIIHHSLGEME
jgi:hypothetical protein